MCSSSGGQLYEYNFWYNHSVLVAVRYAGQEFHLDLHTGRPLTQSNYTRSCINPLHAELYPISHLLALLGSHPILHVSRIRVKNRASYI